MFSFLANNCCSARSFLRNVLIFVSILQTGSSIQALALTTGNHVCEARKYGAVGDGRSLDSPAINRAISDCSRMGGGTVKLTLGTYLSGTIFLASGVTLDIGAGATILASANLADYPRMALSSEGRDTTLILVQDVHDVAITGSGTIDGNGRAFVSKVKTVWTPSFDVRLARQGVAWADRMRLANEGPLSMGPRPGVLLLALRVTNLSLKNFHVVDSPNWTVKIGCSSHILIDRLDVRNNLLIPNNDALDISTSTDAMVTNSYLQAGDDALVIGGPCLDGWCQHPAERIRVNNVTLVSRSAAVRVGPAAKGVHDVSFSHIVVRDSNRGIVVQTRDDETVENITFTGIVLNTRLIDGPWWGAGEPIAVSVAHWDYVSWAKTSALGNIRHLRFSDVRTSSDSPIVIYATEPGHIEDLVFDRLLVSMVPDELNVALGGNLDLQPTSPVEWGVRRTDLPAILMYNVAGIRLLNTQVRWLGQFPDYYTNALGISGFRSVAIEHFRGDASNSKLPAISVQNGTSFIVRDATSTTGALLARTNVR
ncbi:MAG TPA: glycosyl hydrolase family 28 protein [Oculatellaceae cyanobacterium]